MIGVFLWVSVLHALWDCAPVIAVVITLVLTGTSLQYQLLSHGYIPEPTAEQVRLMSILSFAGLAVVAVLGVLTLASWVRTARRERPG